jgi:hypothetical protein
MGRLLLAMALLLAAGGLTLGPPWRAVAQDSGAQVVVERPLPGTSISVQAQISGWAVDPTGPGTGIDAVHVYLDGEPGQPRARLLGQASYGQPRPDVARTLGDARFTNSGFALNSELPPGSHSLFVYAHSAGAGSQDGWNRASVATFETSLIEAVATVVQPGPTPAGDTGRYQTGPASWQGGNTCVRYTGAGSCEASIPVGVSSGASCIQWNQRGQCTNYVGGLDGAVSSGNGAPPAPSVRSVPASGPPSVPTVTSGGAPRPPVGAPRAVAPPSDAASGDEGDGGSGATISAPPADALPAAAPPSGAVPAPPDDTLPAVRVAAPPPAAPLAAGAALTSPPASSGATAAAPPPSASTSRAPAVAPTAVIVLAPVSGGTIEAHDEAIPADAPPPVAESPEVRATAAAIRATSPGAGVAPLRSGCALYIGCGGDTTASAPVATRAHVAVNPPSAPIPPAAAGVLSPNLVPTPTATPTACPPFGGCGPALH